MRCSLRCKTKIRNYRRQCNHTVLNNTKTQCPNQCGGNENSTDNVTPKSRVSSPFSKLKVFKIRHINIASLVKHHHELLVYKQSSSLDVSTFNETGLDKSVSDCKVEIPGYDIVGPDRNRNGAGVSLFIRENVALHFSTRFSN